MVAGSIQRWTPRNGTGVIETGEGVLVWFHLSAVRGEDITTIAEGMRVEVDIEHTPQGKYDSRARSVRRST